MIIVISIIYDIFNDIDIIYLYKLYINYMIKYIFIYKLYDIVYTYVYDHIYVIYVI